MDEKAKKKTSREAADDFWDVSDMLPPRKSGAVFSRDTGTVEISIAPGERSPGGAEIPARGSVPPKEAGREYAPQPVLTYAPENPLVSRVTVWKWPSRYTFYEHFRSDAQKFFPEEGKPAQPVPFFAYTPQYAQMKADQRAWYFWWRNQVRRKIYPDVDYSYLLLYIYEIINLPEMIPPERGLEMLCDVWLAYRERQVKMDRIMTEWVCDYCLIHRLNPPMDRLQPIMSKVLLYSSFKEFYLRFENDSDAYAAALLNFSSGYDWRGSKFYQADTAELFDRHIPAAFTRAVRRLGEQDSRFAASENSLLEAKLSRDSFAGSLCAYNVKRRIDVEYRSCTRSAELKLIITDMVKYAENQVRAMMGIRSRLANPALTAAMKAALDEYFAPLMPLRPAKKKEEEVPAYMKQYERESTPLSPASAMKIEAASWAITDRLVEAFDGEELQVPNAPEKPPAAPEERRQEGLLPRAASHLLAGDGTAFSALARENNLLPATLAEQLNEALYDLVGDAVAEDRGGDFALIEDYREDVEEWLNGCPTQ